jgi:hypoxanthine phosphoribosyltransferase
MSGQPDVLIPEAALRERVGELARAIESDYPDGDVILIGVLRGSFVFMADLIREIPVPVICDFLRMQSYEGTVPVSEPELKMELGISLAGKSVIIIEDIVDTGATAQAVMNLIRGEGAREVRLCSLLRKPSAPPQSVLPVDYLGFDIADQFVVGYGLDHNGRWRNLPYVGVISS